MISYAPSAQAGNTTSTPLEGRFQGLTVGSAGANIGDAPTGAGTGGKDGSGGNGSASYGVSIVDDAWGISMTGGDGGYGHQHGKGRHHHTYGGTTATANAAEVAAMKALMGAAFATMRRKFRQVRRPCGSGGEPPDPPAGTQRTDCTTTAGDHSPAVVVVVWRAARRVDRAGCWVLRAGVNDRRDG